MTDPTLADKINGLDSSYLITKGIQERFKHWQDRFDLYADFASKEGEFGQNYTLFQEWTKSSKFNYQLNKLKQALDAYEQLRANKSDLDPPQFKLLSGLLLERIDIELRKLELNQIRKLEKAQNIRRPEEVISLYSELTKRRKEFTSNINVKPKLSTRVSNKKNLPLVADFFFEQENKTHFNVNIEKAGKIADATNSVSTATGLFTGITSALPDLIRITQNVAQLTTAIPILSSIVGAIPLVLNNIKNWAQNKSTTKKAIGGVALGLAVLGFIGTIVSLTITAAAVAVGGIAVGLAAIGYVHDTVIPYINLRSKISSKTAELDTLNERCKEIKSGISQLTHNEKNLLLTQIEKNWLNKKTKTPADDAELKKAKDLIRAGTVNHDLESNAIIKEALQDKKLDAFLISETKKQTDSLTQQIYQLKSQEKSSRLGLVLGAIAIAGAILVCIPTPVTAILGISLLSGTAAVGLGMKYGPKIVGFFKGLFSSNKNPKMETPTVTQTEMKDLNPDKSLENKRNADHSVKNTLSHARETTATLTIAMAGQTGIEPKFTPTPVANPATNEASLAATSPKTLHEEKQLVETVGNTGSSPKP